MNFEAKRKIDTFGRVSIPIDFRSYYNIGTDEKIVLLSVRDGIQIAKADLFITELLSESNLAAIDKLGRLVIPLAFRREFNIKPYDTLHIVANETCMTVFKAVSNSDN